MGREEGLVFKGSVDRMYWRMFWSSSTWYKSDAGGREGYQKIEELEKPDGKNSS